MLRQAQQGLDGGRGLARGDVMALLGTFYKLQQGLGSREREHHWGWRGLKTAEEEQVARTELLSGQRRPGSRHARLKA